MKTILMIAFFSVFCTTVFAVESTLVVQQNHEEHSEQKPVILNGFYLYIGKEGSDSILWSYDADKNTNTKLLHVNNGELKFLGNTDSHLVAVQSDVNSPQIWKTDGTIENTVVIPSTSESPLITQVENWFVYADWERNTVFKTDGNSVITLTVNGPHNDYKCVFSNGNYILNSGTDSSSVGNDYKFILVKDDVVQDLTPMLPAPNDYGIFYTAELTKANNLCFANVLDEYYSKQIVVIDEMGTLTTLDEWAGVENLKSVYFNSEQGLYYAVQADTSDTGFVEHVLKLDVPNKTILDSYEKESSLFYVRDLMFFDDSVIVNYHTPTASPAESLIEFLDKDLNVFHPPIGEAPLRNKGYPRTAQWLNQDVLMFSAQDNTKLWSYQKGEWRSLLTYDGQIGRSLTAVENEPQAYLKTINNDSQFNTYRLYQAPEISKNTAGVWFDPEFNRQGLTINHGVRGDDSEYLFITIYTFDEGKPLWMSGVLDLAPNMMIASLSLFRYEGLNLWQADIEPQEGPIGTLSFEHSSCNLLDVNFSINNENHSIQAMRMDNKAIQSVCQD